MDERLIRMKAIEQEVSEYRSKIAQLLVEYTQLDRSVVPCQVYSYSFEQEAHDGKDVED